MSSISFEQFSFQAKEAVEKELEQIIKDLHAPEILKKSMQYSLQAGGKRIRPLLTFSVLAALGVDWKKGTKVAAAVEMIHTYSLIHDDLPSMDDDDLRRGKPTNHKVYGEAIAILAGDALLTHSFKVLSTLDRNGWTDAQILELITGLSESSGAEGMVGGQVADLLGENKQLTIEELEFIHTHKTGKLLAYSVDAGCILGNASDELRQKLKTFSYHLGLAFQIRDDILDEEGDQERIGKPVGSDLSNKKSTYPQLLSLEGAKEKLNYHINASIQIIQNIPGDTTFLKTITDLIATRDH